MEHSFDVAYAQEHFDDLVALVDAGEYVEITMPGGKAVVMLKESEYLELKAQALAGIWKGKEPQDASERETKHLFGHEANAAHLLEGLAQAERGEVTEIKDVLK